MEYARPRKISKSMSVGQLAGMDAAAADAAAGAGAGGGSHGGGGRPPRESCRLAPCCARRGRGVPSLCPTSDGAAAPVPAAWHTSACNAGRVLTPNSRAPPPGAVPPGQGAADKLGPLGKPIRRTNTFRQALCAQLACCGACRGCWRASAVRDYPGQHLVPTAFCWLLSVMQRRPLAGGTVP